MTSRASTLYRTATLSWLIGLVACSDPVTPPDPTDRAPGTTDFVSADGYPGQTTRDSGDMNAGVGGGAEAGAPADDGAQADPSPRDVVEGDIYRVLGNGLLANLNAYRGLQIIDVSDPSSPAIVGRYAVTGNPVEMYIHDDTAYVLLNDWQGYYGSRFSAAVEVWNGGVVLSIDLSDPSTPVLRDRAVIPGYLQKSRLVHNNTYAALYLVTGGYDSWANDDGTWSWESRTVVKSFDVAAGDLVEKSQINLGGYVADIQATPEALLVARNDWNWSGDQSQVSIVDIRDPTGVMVEGDQVLVSGHIETQFNMDLHQGVLRVVSGARFSGTRTNHLQTFDATDIHNLTPIDHDTFGDGEDLYGTLFLGNKAFFVTYLRTDPFHAFEITDEGIATEHSEFIVSGWNDYFRAVMADTRLIGIGVNDESSRTMAVSLYDITDIDNPTPLVTRAEVQADSSWSEASYDHRAFSVLENAVEMSAGDVVETGLVLLPFSGWSQEEQRYTAGVQIFTFSDSTLTARGVMVHGTQVRRSFQVDDALTGNLSEAELSLFDTADPQAPEELGRIELAPNYTDILVLDDNYAVRVRNPRDYFYGWWGSDTELPPAVAEIIDRADDPDAAPAIVSFEFPSSATLHKAGSHLVSVDSRIVNGTSWPYTYASDVVVYDVANPTMPVETGRLTTNRLRPSGGYYDGGGDCFDCGWYGGYGGFTTQAYGMEGALAFPQRVSEQENLGTIESCSTYVNETERCDEATGNCTFYSGGIYCTSINGAPESCEGEIQRCEYSSADGHYECVPVEPGSVATAESCYTYDYYRYWQRFEVEVLNLRNPSAPSFYDTRSLPQHRDAVNVVQDGSTLWLTTREPATIDGDARPYVRYHAQPLDLLHTTQPTLGAAVNIPGELLGVAGNTLYTRDLLWGNDTAETWVHRLTLANEVASLEASKRFANSWVQDVKLDGAGHLLVTHRMYDAYPSPGVVVDEGVVGGGESSSRDYQQLSVLSGSEELATLSTIDVDTWASLRDARAGRALFQVPGGLLVLNLDDASQPFPQAFFATRAWPHSVLVDERQIFFAAGRYGVYAFDLDAFQLLEGNPL